MIGIKHSKGDHVMANFQAVRKLRGLTQKQVAELTNIPLGTLRRWEQGVNEPSIEAIIQLSNLYKVSTDALLGARHSEELEGTIKRMSIGVTTEVPLYGSISAGSPLEMIQNDQTYPIPEKMYKKYPQGFLLRVSGESMNRKLPHGSYALIDPYQKDIVDMQPFALRLGNTDAVIKLVHLLNNGIELIPDSIDPTYTSEILDFGKAETIEPTILGRVVWYTLPFDWRY